MHVGVKAIKRFPNIFKSLFPHLHSFHGEPVTTNGSQRRQVCLWTSRIMRQCSSAVECIPALPLPSLKPHTDSLSSLSSHWINLLTLPCLHQSSVHTLHGLPLLLTHLNATGLVVTDDVCLPKEHLIEGNKRERSGTGDDRVTSSLRTRFHWQDLAEAWKRKQKEKENVTDEILSQLSLKGHYFFNCAWVNVLAAGQGETNLPGDSPFPLRPHPSVFS